LASPDAHIPVLIVDDDEAIRESLRVVLEDEGYRVVEAPDGLTGLEVLHGLGTPAVVLTNHTMPRLDGPGLINTIVEDTALAEHCALIYMTASNRILPSTLSEQLHALQAPVLRKPFDLDALINQIEAARATGRAPCVGCGGDGDRERGVDFGRTPLVTVPLELSPAPA
jgi:CheY-like chemotaxis protein